MKWLFKKLTEWLEKRARQRDLERFLKNPLLKKALELFVESKLLALILKEMDIPPVVVVPIVNGKFRFTQTPYTYVAYITTTGDCPYEFKVKLFKVTLPRKSLVADVFLVQLTDEEFSQLQTQTGVKVL